MGATVLPNSAGALSLRQKPVDFPDGAGRARLPPTLRKDRAPAAFLAVARGSPLWTAHRGAGGSGAGGPERKLTARSKVPGTNTKAPKFP
jgi:hypothetical protein